MSRRLLIDIVCRNCPRVLAREQEDGSWSVKSDKRDGDQWRTTSEWTETLTCPDCKTVGYVDVADMLRAGHAGRRRVRVPIRPPV